MAAVGSNGKPDGLPWQAAAWFYSKRHGRGKINPVGVAPHFSIAATRNPLCRGLLAETLAPRGPLVPERPSNYIWRRQAPRIGGLEALVDILRWPWSVTVRLTQRREIYYSGRVQGVGFRYTAYRIARRHDVVGCVRNLPDGRVHMIVEGVPGGIDAFLAEVAEAMRGCIRDQTVDVLAPTGEYVDFTIRS